MSMKLNVLRRPKAFVSYIAIAAASFSISPAISQAKEWPSQPISMVIPFSPGGTTDIIGRTVGNKLATNLGVSIVPENKGGAAGNIAANYVANATPDGYTIALDHIGFAFNHTLASNSKAPQKNIAPVALIGSTPNVLVVTNSMPVTTLKEFIDYAKAHPNEINFGSGGVGSAGHLPMELLQSVTDTKMVHVPYKGSGPAMTDLIGGRIQAMLMTIPAVIGAIRTNQVRAIATTGTTRPAALADLPTFKEAGVDNFIYEPWYGIFVPKGVPETTKVELHSAVNRAITDTATADRLRGEGLETNAITQQEFVNLVQTDIKKWGAIINELGLTSQ